MARDNKRQNYNLELKKLRNLYLKTQLEKLEIDMGKTEIRPMTRQGDVDADGGVYITREHMENTRKSLSRKLGLALEGLEADKSQVQKIDKKIPSLHKQDPASW